ncbi:hypothetical protein CEQ90_08315 [Lewinellaceae bacterium SD302]|nr:hypothetical protein CEQ90_08315 [Lewinellaceae bacterium SD302]
MALYDINRVALILRPSEELLNWAIREDPALEEEIDPEDSDDLASVYLLPDFDDLDDADVWIEKNFVEILESLLEEWIPNEAAWPDEFSFKHFELYADYAFTNMVVDTQDESYDE